MLLSKIDHLKLFFSFLFFAGDSNIPSSEMCLLKHVHLSDWKRFHQRARHVCHSIPNNASYCLWMTGLAANGREAQSFPKPLNERSHNPATFLSHLKPLLSSRTRGLTGHKLSDGCMSRTLGKFPNVPRFVKLSHVFTEGPGLVWWSVQRWSNNGWLQHVTHNKNMPISEAKDAYNINPKLKVVSSLINVKQTSKMLGSLWM